MLKAHSIRTAAKEASYLLDSGCVKENSRILDVGCGPGSITCDFASLVPKGHVIGMETNDDVVKKAQELAESRALTNIEFKVGDAHALDFPDASFDIVHAHQVLQHVRDPVQCLREMIRVTKPGGVVAARTADVGTQAMYPDPDGLIAEFKQLFLNVSHKLGSNVDGGRKMMSWAIAAGAKDIKPSAEAYYITTPEGRQSWADGLASELFVSDG